MNLRALRGRGGLLLAGVARLRRRWRASTLAAPRLERARPRASGDRSARRWAARAPPLVLGGVAGAGGPRRDPRATHWAATRATAGRLAADTRLLLGANPDHRLDPSGPAELRELAAAVNDLAERRRVAEREVAREVSAARADVEQERNRLAALMADLDVAVLVCQPRRARPALQRAPPARCSPTTRRSGWAGRSSASSTGGW